MDFSTGFSEPLIYSSLVILIGLILTLRLELPWNKSVILGIIKVGIPFVFFTFFNYGQFYLMDDLNYLNHAQTMIVDGYTPITAIFSDYSSAPISEVVGSEHFVYDWLVMVGCYFLGVHYFVPVLSNVLLAGIAAILFSKLHRQIGFSYDYSKRACIFFLIHWDVVAWSSFVSLKDTLVLTLTLWAFCSIYSLNSKFNIKALLSLMFVLWVFLSLRHYISYLIVISFIGWAFLQLSGVKKYFLVLMGGIILLLYAPKDTGYIMSNIRSGDTLYTAVKFLFTPRFWDIEDSYSFIAPSAFLHWCFFAPMVWAAYVLWKELPKFRLLAIYFIVVVLFYSNVPLLLGPRHRYQLCFIMALCQFYAISVYLASAVAPRKERSIISPLNFADAGYDGGPNEFQQLKNLRPGDHTPESMNTEPKL